MGRSVETFSRKDEGQPSQPQMVAAWRARSGWRCRCVGSRSHLPPLGGREKSPSMVVFRKVERMEAAARQIWRPSGGGVEENPLKSCLSVSRVEAGTPGGVWMTRGEGHKDLFLLPTAPSFTASALNKPSSSSSSESSSSRARSTGQTQARTRTRIPPGTLVFGGCHGAFPPVSESR